MSFTGSSYVYGKNGVWSSRNRFTCRFIPSFPHLGAIHSLAIFALPSSSHHTRLLNFFYTRCNFHRYISFAPFLEFLAILSRAISLTRCLDIEGQKYISRVDINRVITRKVTRNNYHGMSNNWKKLWLFIIAGRRLRALISHKNSFDKMDSIYINLWHHMSFVFNHD